MQTMNATRIRSHLRAALNHSAVALAAGILLAAPASAAPPVTDGLVLALDASALAGLSDGARVETWTDTSSSANNATATGSAATYHTGVLNGHPVLRFSDDGNASFNFTEVTAIQSVFWVVKKTASGLHFLLGDSGAYDFHQGDSTIWSSDYASGSIQTGTTRLMGTVIDGTTTPLPAESFQLISLVTSGPVRANQLSLDRNIGGRSWVGDIAEVLIYDRALTTEEETLVGLYLTAKYGLTTAYQPLGPPPAPTGLVANPLHLGVRLDWTASIGATGYQVERLTGAGGTIDATYEASGTSYTDTAVTTGGPYFYVVRAVNTLGTGLASAEVSASPSAVPVNQTLTFALGLAVTKTATDAPFADTASAFPSGVTVTYSVPPAEQTVATVDASTGVVTLGVPGTAHIVADAAGNGDFNAAQASQTLTVNQATTVLTWATPVPMPVGMPLGGTQLNASSGGVDGTFVYDPPSGSVLALGTHTLSVHFTPTNTVKYSTPAATTVSLLVTPVTSNIAFLSGNWSTPGIWNLGHVPQSDEDAIILQGIDVARDSSQTAKSVTVTSGGQLGAYNLSNAYTGNTICLNGGTVRFGRDTFEDPYVAGGNFVVQANSTFDSYDSNNSGPTNLANQYGSLDFAAANPVSYPDGYQLTLSDNGVSYNFGPRGVRSQFNGSIISHSGSIYFYVKAWDTADSNGVPTLEFNNTLVRAGQKVTITANSGNDHGDCISNGSLSGTLGVATLGGAELLTNNEVTLFAFPTTQFTLTDTSSFDTSGGLWSKSVTSPITGTLASPLGSCTVGGNATFASANAGNVSLTDLTASDPYKLTLTLANAGDQATVMAQLAKNPAFSSITAVGADQVSLHFTAAAATQYFAWDNIHTSSADWHLGGDLIAVSLATDLSVPGYASWQSLNGASGQTFSQDHDNDGVPNGIEYFLGGPNGRTTGVTALPGVTHTGGALSVTWTMGAGYTGIYNADFLVETSATLTGVWHPESEGGSVTITGRNVTYTFPVPLGAKKFVRLVVTGP